MNILFIYSLQDIQSILKPLRNFEQIQLGISYISSLLKKHGHVTKLLVLTRETKNEKIDKYILEFKPDVVCFTIIFSEYKFIYGIAEYIKKRYPGIYLLAGGSHVTLNPEECVTADFDAICIGEGEFPALELVEKLKNGILPSKIQNLWIKYNGLVEKNPPRPFLEDLNSLPFPDRKMWEPWIADLEGSNSVLLGRGCPFQCAYCCNHALKRIAAGEYVRLRSVNNIIDELRSIAADNPAIKKIYFEIETIAVNRNFALELSDRLKQLNEAMGKRLTFGTNIRITPDINLEDIFISFRSCGFKFINIGVESGSEKVRTQILKRNYSNDDIIRTVDLARKYSLQVCFYNLMGIPGETLMDFKETIKINCRCLPENYYLSIYFPYPGTDLYSLCVKNGLINASIDTKMERSKAVLDLPQFSARQIHHNYIWFDYNVYKGHKPLYKILAKVALAKIKTDYRLTRFYRTLTNFKIFKDVKDLVSRN